MGVWMPDLSVAHSVLRALRQPQSPNNAPLGTGRRHESILKSMNVPVVPRVPNQNEPWRVACPCDVLERAAILEFCAGLPRKEADALALAEFGIPRGRCLHSPLRVRNDRWFFPQR
jgi:hypothetical protein